MALVNPLFAAIIRQELSYISRHFDTKCSHLQAGIYISNVAVLSRNSTIKSSISIGLNSAIREVFHAPLVLMFGLSVASYNRVMLV
jgi:hypothetical protein